MTKSDAVACAKTDIFLRYIQGLIDGVPAWTRLSTTMIRDGRVRKGAWEQLLSDGYIEKRTEPAVLDEQTTIMTDFFYPTSKCFDAVPEQKVSLETHFRYDSRHHHDPANVPFVVWDSLTSWQKVNVLRAMQRGHGSYRLGLADSGTGNVIWFGLGEGGMAAESHGCHRRTLVVTDDSVQTKRDKACRDEMRQRWLKTGLSWFLRKNGVLADGEEIPVVSEDFFTSDDQGSLTGDASLWEKNLPYTLEEIDRLIANLQAKRVKLELLQRYVDSMGGWQAFQTAYHDAIEEQVEKYMTRQSEKSTAGTEA